MWSLLSWKNELVTIIVGHDQLVINWIIPQKKTRNTIATFILKAHETYAIDAADAHHPFFYNMSRITNLVKLFVEKNKIKNAHVYMAVAPPRIVEQFVACPIANPTHDTFTAITPKHLLWDYVYLYPDESRNAFIFYMSGITQQQLLQYKLMAIKSNVTLRMLMPQNMALIQLYYITQGAAFRHSQLAVCLQRLDNHIDNLFTSEIIHRLLTIDPHVSINFSEQAPSLRIALGLALCSELEISGPLEKRKPIHLSN